MAVEIIQPLGPGRKVARAVRPLLRRCPQCIVLEKINPATTDSRQHHPRQQHKAHCTHRPRHQGIGQLSGDVVHVLGAGSQA